MKLPSSLVSFCLASIVLATCAGDRTFAQSDLADVIERCEQSVIRIDVQGLAGASIGSGYIVSTDGVFVTNVHVMAGATKASAVFPNGKRYEIKGTYHIDPARDICVGKIEGEFDPIELSGALPRKGDVVVALGCPHGLEFSATRGIVSAIRDDESARKMLGRPQLKGTWVQVDAAISGGNSGGPLINSEGKVVAMSTLGSASAEAQNLNFGISIDDIRAAIQQAKSANLKPLRDAVGKIDMEEVSPESGALVERTPVPVEAFESYLERGKEQYSDFFRTIRKTTREEEKILDLMEKGEPFIPGNSPGHLEMLVVKRRYNDLYYFRDQRTMTRRIADQKRKINRLSSLKDELKREMDAKSLFTVLWEFGPRLDTRSVNEVGFMEGATVLRALTDHDVIVMYEEQPYMMWAKSTAGYSPGESVPPGPVFVAGTKTVVGPDGPMSVTILNAVTETELRQAVFGTEGNVAIMKDFRTWTDNTGTYKVEAVVEKLTDDAVILKKRDGQTITVPFKRLSEQDLLLLGK